MDYFYIFHCGFFIEVLIDGYLLPPFDYEKRGSNTIMEIIFANFFTDFNTMFCGIYYICNGTIFSIS